MNRSTLVIGAAALTVVALAAGYGLGRWPRPAAPPRAAAGEGERRVLYWYDPMVPTQHFDKPGKSPFMDMQLVPKYADEPAAGAGVAIDPARVQSLGVRYAIVERASLGQDLTAPGVIDFNQREVATVQAKTAGFVQRVYGRAPGDVVGAGAPLVDLLVPEWAGAQAEFLAVKRTGDPALIDASRQRLTLLGMAPGVIAEVERSGQPRTLATVTTPTGGVIRTLSVRAGMTLSAGQTLAEINGLGTVWVNASVPAELAATVRQGQAARVTVAGDETRPLNGRVTAILPEVSGDTRTLQVRVELPNPGGRLRPGGFVSVGLAGGTRPALTIPSEAVIRTGKRALVMVALDGGRFQPAEVRTGAESGGKTEILSGLSEGEKIVASGQFLLDSEASLAGVQPRAAAPATAAAGPAVYRSVGRIERLDPANVTVSHEPIPALGWPAMTMSFRLPNPGLAQGLKVGDRVSFAFVETKAGPTLQSIARDAAR